MPEYRFGGCDGHHEMVDFKLQTRALVRPGLTGAAGLGQLGLHLVPTARPSRLALRAISLPGSLSLNSEAVALGAERP
jgi:hypothetical protein